MDHLDAAILVQQWASEHVFAASLLVMLCIIVFTLALEDLLNVALCAWTRALRAIKVCARGWPPEHLDADGDWKPAPKSEEPGELTKTDRVIDGKGYTWEHRLYRKPVEGGTPGGKQ